MIEQNHQTHRNLAVVDGKSEHSRVIVGPVVEGRKLGRLLGFPTANVEHADEPLPQLGVYATMSRMQDGRLLPGVANFGMNPTTGLVTPRLEVHLFDFNEDIYGQVLTTRLVVFLRAEACFDDLDQLVVQIRRDVADARGSLAAAEAGGSRLSF